MVDYEREREVKSAFSSHCAMKPSGDSGRQWEVLCPLHDDADHSASLCYATNGNWLFKCHKCGHGTEIVKAAFEALGLKPWNHYAFPEDPAYAGKRGPAVKPRPVSPPPKARPAPKQEEPAPTLEQLAEAKQLPVGWLVEHFGLRDIPDGSGVGIPYRDEKYRRLFMRTRVKLSGKKHTRQPFNTQVAAYGLDRLKDAREAGGSLIAVEGESDTWTLEYHGFHAYGIPGADATEVVQPEHLIGITNLYVWREPDGGGDTFTAGIASRLRSIGWEGQAWEISHPTAKDPSALHIADEAGFKAAMEEVLKAKVRLGRGGVADKAGGRGKVKTPAVGWLEPGPDPVQDTTEQNATGIVDTSSNVPDSLILIEEWGRGGDPHKAIWDNTPSEDPFPEQPSSNNVVPPPATPEPEGHNYPAEVRDITSMKAPPPAIACPRGGTPRGLANDEKRCGVVMRPPCHGYTCPVCGRRTLCARTCWFGEKILENNTPLRAATITAACWPTWRKRISRAASDARYLTVKMPGDRMLVLATAGLPETETLEPPDAVRRLFKHFGEYIRLVRNRPYAGLTPEKFFAALDEFTDFALVARHKPVNSCADWAVERQRKDGWYVLVERLRTKNPGPVAHALSAHGLLDVSTSVNDSTDPTDATSQMWKVSWRFPPDWTYDKSCTLKGALKALNDAQASAEFGDIAEFLSLANDGEEGEDYADVA